MIAQASFITAPMFYVSVIHTTAYYGYFLLSPFSLGVGFTEFDGPEAGPGRGQNITSAAGALRAPYRDGYSVTP